MTVGGLFLVLEGIDGSGTTTQALLLKRRVESLHRRVLLTREPTSGPIGRFLRQALVGGLTDEAGGSTSLEPAAMALLFSADRVDHLHREVLPALHSGAVVICDRYDLSGLIYQSETSSDGADSLPWLRQLNRKARRPDLTLVLDVDPEIAEERRRARAEKEELYEKRELQRRLASAYSRARDYLPNDRILILPGTGDIAEVEREIVAALRTCPEFAWIAE